ncbi:hypothetical protein [Enteractinococcus coprophilus]|uniref:Diaminopimelate decarboxylase n=1 Tax=Enteractinococcus coprophilus TaxID=1027633 RepID=A0A543AG42_9MICC|nr:hypothetical protein [Enteractinococcus coprophilus]TQL71540.1 diaminopimelate decarboxylase [Enteractinococcus coprophilus]
MASLGSRIATQRHTAVEQLAPALTDTTPVLGVIDYNILDQLIELVHQTYSEEWFRPAVSVGTIGIPGVLEHFRARGIGVLTSSAVELEIARHSGYPLVDVIHNAPVKTHTQLQDVTDGAVSFSISNFAELARVDQLLQDTENYAGTIGLQITPQASADDNATTFAHVGIGLRDHRKDLIEVFLERPWLTQLHVSFDTPPTSLQQTAEQVAAIYQFAEDIEHAVGGPRIQGLHFGAGASMQSGDEEQDPALDNHRFVHQAMIPDLMYGKYQFTIDFSEFLTARAGMILARVEYTKDLDGRMIAVVHADAQPHPETSRIIVFDEHGNHKDDFQQYYYDVAGPNGLVAQSVPLPAVQEGDVLALLDIGAAAFGPRSHFTAPIYGIRADGLLTESSVLSAGRSTHDLTEAAGIYQPEKLLH